MNDADAGLGDVTRLLGKLKLGDKDAEGPLLELVYPELKRMAGRFLQSERTGHTLQPTALVHEAYLRMVGQLDRDWENRCRFFGAAAQVMRWILVDHAKAKSAAKRGGALHRVELTDQLAVSEDSVDEILAVDEALKKLAVEHPRKARVVELRFFGGLTEEEAARVLGVDSRTVKRDWQYARAWLYGEIGHSSSA